MATQLCEYTKTTNLYTYKQVNCMACELPLNKAVIKRKKSKTKIACPPLCELEYGHDLTLWF